MMKISKIAVLGMVLTTFAEAQELQCPKDYAKKRDQRGQRDYCYISATYSCPDKDYPEYLENDNKNVISLGGSVAMMPGFDMKDYTRNVCAKRTPKGFGGACLPGTPRKDMLLVGGHRRDLDKYCYIRSLRYPIAPQIMSLRTKTSGREKYGVFTGVASPIRARPSAVPLIFFSALVRESGLKDYSLRIAARRKNIIL